MLSFPPHLVRTYLDRFEVAPGMRVLDPFCGTGTVLVEAKKRGLASAGVEANPLAHFASATKLAWDIDPAAFLTHARRVAALAEEDLAAQGTPDAPFFHLLDPDAAPALRTLSQDKLKLLLTNSISPLPLHKALVLLDHLERNRDDRFYNHERLALAKALVYSCSNLHFGPEVGVGQIKPDAPVVAPWLANAEALAVDLRNVRDRASVEARAYHADARQIDEVLERQSVDAVITSPPYPNEKDYTRTTRLESVLLGFVTSKEEQRAVKRGLMRSNTRGVYKDDDDSKWVQHNPEIQRIAADIEARRIELGKTSGFERQYARVTQLYFGVMARHLSELRTILRPGAHLAYVVGDQASYLRVMIRTGQLLLGIAEELGYERVGTGIGLFRTRLATATGEQLREEIVLLRWPG